MTFEVPCMVLCTIMFAYHDVTGNDIQTIDKSEPIAISKDNWHKLMYRFEWFACDGKYRNFTLQQNENKFIVIETIIDAVTFDSTKRQYIIDMPAYGSWIKSNIKVCVCDGVIAGIVTLVDYCECRYAIRNIRHEGGELSFSKWEFDTASAPIWGFYVAYDNARKCMHRFYQLHDCGPIIDIDGYFSDINSCHADIYSIIVYNGVVSVFDMHGYDSFDVGGICVGKAEYIHINDVIVYGHLVVGVVYDGEYKLEARDMRTGDIYEIVSNEALYHVSAIIHIV